MYCPNCRDEFRAGFTRCAACDVDLVDDLDAAQVQPDTPPAGQHVAISMRDFCGFLDLDDARDARDRLRASRIAADILIRQAPAGDGDDLLEEYWLRVDAARHREAVPIVGEDADDSGGR